MAPPARGPSAALAHLARRRPGELALVAAGRRTTHAALDARVGALAAALAARGVGPGAVVAVLLGARAEGVEALRAAERLGGVPLLLDRDGAPTRWRTLLGAARPRALVVDAAAWAALGPDVPVGEVVLVDDPVRAGDDGLLDLDALLHAHRDAPRVADAAPAGEDVVRLLADADAGELVPLRAAQAEAALLAQVVELGLTARDRCLVAGGLHAVGGRALPAAAVAHVGGALVLLEAFRPDAVLAALEADRVTCLWLERAQAEALAVLPALRRHDLRALRLVVVAADGRDEPARRALADALPRAWVTPSYGTARTAGGLTLLDPEPSARRLATAGRPLLGCAVEVVGPDGRPLPAGEEGDVVVAEGDVVVAGPAVAAPGGRLATGDRGLLDDGGHVRLIAEGGPPVL